MILAPEDQLLHLCIHGTIQHQLRFDMRFLTDIAVYSDYSAQQLDWHALVARVRRLGWGHSVWLALTLASRLLGAPIPPVVCAQLRPAPLEASILNTAVARLFASERAATTSSRNFAMLWDQTQARGAKVRLIFSRIFVSRVELAAMYNLSPESLRLPLYYFLRTRELAHKYLPLTWRILRIDTKSPSIVLQTVELDRWLSTPAPQFLIEQELPETTDQ